MLSIKGKIARLMNDRLSLKALQPLYNYLYSLSLFGMNIGGATNYLDKNGESSVIKLVAQTFNKKADLPIIFDVGAHNGSYTEELHSILGDRCRIFCFEPSKNLFESLIKNTEKFSHFVKLNQLGLSDTTGSVTLYDSGNNIPTMLSESFDILNEKVSSSESIEIARLDEFCLEHKIDKIDFLKIDVEGNELKVLQGAGEMIEQNKIDFIQFEFGQHCVASRSFFYDFYSLLNPHYKLFRILPNSLYEFQEYHPKQEVFVSATNYLAINRSVTL